MGWPANQRNSIGSFGPFEDASEFLLLFLLFYNLLYANKESFTPSSVFCMHCVSQNFWIALSRHSATMLKKVERADTLALFLITGDIYSSTTETKFPQMAFIWLKKFLPASNVLRNFLMTGYWIFPNAFSVSVEMIIQIFIFTMFTRRVGLTVLKILNQPRNPGYKPTWLWGTIYLLWYWI